jgi:hypothetical protein
VIPVIIAAILAVGLWRSMQMFRRETGAQPLDASAIVPRTPKSKRVAKRIGIVVATWIVVTGLVAFYRIDWALFAGMIVVVGGAVWIWKTADPMRIDMDELDRELMQLLEDES